MLKRWIVSIPIKYRNCSFRIVGWLNLGRHGATGPVTMVDPARMRDEELRGSESSL